MSYSIYSLATSSNEMRSQSKFCRTCNQNTYQATLRKQKQKLFIHPVVLAQGSLSSLSFQIPFSRISRRVHLRQTAMFQKQTQHSRARILSPLQLNQISRILQNLRLDTRIFGDLDQDIVCKGVGDKLKTLPEFLLFTHVWEVSSKYFSQYTYIEHFKFPKQGPTFNINHTCQSFTAFTNKCPISDIQYINCQSNTD